MPVADLRHVVAIARDIKFMFDQPVAEHLLFDEAIAVSVDEVQAWSGAPVSKQTRLDVFETQRLHQQRIGVEINLSDGEVVGCAPVGVDLAQPFAREWIG